MKSTIVRGALAALLSVAVLPVLPTAGLAAPAKPAPTAPKGPNPLNLTPAQQAKFEAIQKQYMAEIQAVQSGMGTPAQKEAKAKAIGQKYKAKAMAVLTPSQRAKENQLLAQQKAAMEKQRQAMIARQKKTQAFMKTLTPQQKAKRDQLQKKYLPKMQAIYNDKKMTPQQKITQLQSLNTKAQAEWRAVLTPKQRAMLGQ